MRSAKRRLRTTFTSSVPGTDISSAFCFVADSIMRIVRIWPRVTNEIASPLRPARPVRPMRCT